MKKAIHPEYFPQAKITCACGQTFTIGSTVKEINVELCSHCHPFYTGKQKLVDTAGRVDKFKAKVAKQAETSALRQGKKAKKVKSDERKAVKAGKTSKEK